MQSRNVSNTTESGVSLSCRKPSGQIHINIIKSLPLPLVDCQAPCKFHWELHYRSCCLRDNITICAEQPKLNPHIPAMQQELAACMGCEPGQVSIKATTTERLGYTGRGEGIAAQAVALIETKPSQP